MEVSHQILFESLEAKLKGQSVTLTNIKPESVEEEEKEEEAGLNSACPSQGSAYLLRQSPSGETKTGPCRPAVVEWATLTSAPQAVIGQLRRTPPASIHLPDRKSVV